MLRRWLAPPLRSQCRWFAGTKPKALTKSFSEFSENDIVETFLKGGGPGGSSVNASRNCVRLVHKETGITVRVHDCHDRDQNRVIARRRLRDMLLAQQSESGLTPKQERKVERIRRSKAKAKKRALKRHQERQGTSTASASDADTDDDDSEADPEPDPGVEALRLGPDTRVPEPVATGASPGDAQAADSQPPADAGPATSEQTQRVSKFAQARARLLNPGAGR
mmetsp:Transcript_21622/g.55354  ORF Transcript_21622/g.55354 Transcript_21622/m.55354 type:complete len:223 (+) Transcript_21622:32-700(+)